MSQKYPSANRVEVENAVRTFVGRVDDLFGYYMDSTIGFRASLLQLKEAESKKKAQSPNVDFNSEPVSYGSGNWRHPGSRVLHETTVGDLRRRNSDGGLNHVRAAQHFLVLLFSFWEEEHRKLIANALGIAKNDLKVPVIGDVRLLRIDIIHHLGKLKPDTFRQLEVLHIKRGVDLVSRLRFTKLAADQEIRFFPPDVYFLLTLVRKAMDEIVVDVGGADPNSREFKRLPL